jgi:PAS domain-containing protein
MKNQDKTKEELIQDLERAHQTISALEALEDDRKRAEEALRQNEERTRLIVESALDAVITMNTQGLITGWNPQAETIFGIGKRTTKACNISWPRARGPC